MKIAGIIAEYNPFHNGHARHIEQTRLQTGAESVICLMSGSFVQRGEPAFMDKFARARAALEAGADMVLELPVIYSLQAARYFALGGVRIFNALGVVSVLSFGREGEELPEMRPDLSERLKEGKSFPAAAFKRAQPNDMLAAEYLRAMQETDSAMEIVWLKRRGAHDSGEADSALGIRKAIRSGRAPFDALPEPSARALRGQLALNRAPWQEEELFRLISARARAMSAEHLKSILGADEGLEYRLKRAAEEARGLEELINLVKTKRYTRARVCRFLMCVLLGAEKEHALLANGQPPYIRCLGVRREKKDLLSLCAQAGALPFYTSGARLKREGGELFNLERRASDIYELLLPAPGRGGRDMTEGLIVL